MARPSANASSQTDKLYAGRTEESLSEVEKTERDNFVREYIKDFNGRQAMVRCGVANITTAGMKASHWLREPYVAKRLDALVRQLQPSDIVTRQEVMAAMWKEANNQKSFGGERIAALAHIAKMLGMMQNKESDSNASAPVGVMLIPCSTPEDWALAAPIAQQMLKSQAAKHSA